MAILLHLARSRAITAIPPPVPGPVPGPGVPEPSPRSYRDIGAVPAPGHACGARPGSGTSRTHLRRRTSFRPVAGALPCRTSLPASRSPPVPGPGSVPKACPRCPAWVRATPGPVQAPGQVQGPRRLPRREARSLATGHNCRDRPGHGSQDISSATGLVTGPRTSPWRRPWSGCQDINATTGPVAGPRTSPRRRALSGAPGHQRDDGPGHGPPDTAATPGHEPPDTAATTGHGPPYITADCVCQRLPDGITAIHFRVKVTAISGGRAETALAST
jgi:hypothetical protein